MFHHLRTFIVLFSFQLGKARESAADANLIFLQSLVVNSVLSSY